MGSCHRYVDATIKFFMKSVGDIFVKLHSKLFIRVLASSGVILCNQFFQILKNRELNSTSQVSHMILIFGFRRKCEVVTSKPLRLDLIIMIQPYLLFQYSVQLRLESLQLRWKKCWNVGLTVIARLYDLHTSLFTGLDINRKREGDRKGASFTPKKTLITTSLQSSCLETKRKTNKYKNIKWVSN